MTLGRSVELKEQRRHPILRLFLGFIALVIIALIVGVFGSAWWLKHAMRDSLPQLDGQMRLPGLSAAVNVRRDQHGVPHIEAANLDDLFEAQGYITAQDRLWQMDMARRVAAGELAELLGKNLVEHDRVQRVLQMRATAERMAAGLSERDRRYFEDYARGVNAYVDSHHNHLPAEFRLLRYQPKAWQPVDSILIGLNMVQILDEHWQDKLGREKIEARLGPTLAADLYPTGSWRDHPPTVAPPDLTAPQQAIPDVPLDESQTSLHDLLHLLELTLRVALGEAIRIDGPVATKQVGYRFFLQPPAISATVATLRGVDAVSEHPTVDAVSVHRGPGANLDWRDGTRTHLIAVVGAAKDYDELQAVDRLLRQEVSATYADVRH